MATEEQALLGEQARNAIARILIARVRHDPYPSATQMDLIEQVIPPYVMREYLNVLLEKIATDSAPSIPMLRRIARLSQQL